MKLAIVFWEKMPQFAMSLALGAAVLKVGGQENLAVVVGLWALLLIAWWSWNKWGVSRYAHMVVWSVRYGHRVDSGQRACLARLAFDWRLLGTRSKLSQKLRPLAIFTMEIGADELPVVTSVKRRGRNLEISIKMPVGQTVETLRDKTSVIAASAEVLEVRVVEGADRSRAIIVVPTGPDPLDQVIDLERMPVQTQTGASIPVAVDEDMAVVNVGTAHTLALGATGSGKGSVIWSRLMAQAPRLAEGTLRLYGCDSKESEVKAAERLFCSVAYTAEEHAAVFREVRAELERRGKGMSGRSFEASRDWPEILVVIDEITSLSAIFDDAKSRNAALADLRMILSLGRSRGITVMGAGQDPTKEAMPLRNLFPQAVALRLRDATETRLTLGEGAVEAGANPHQIPVASAANSYATAGLAWLADEHGRLRRVRFPYVSDDAMGAFEQAFSNHSGHSCQRDPLRKAVAEDAA